jgi:putative PIN family toxin of toxin-antitoxin system
MAWEASRFSVICSSALLFEYERVLAYPDIARLIYPELLRAFHSHLKHDLEIVDLPRIAPVCRDPDDDKVIATAVYGMVDYLVTEDEDLYTPEVAKVLNEAGIALISMTELIKVLDRL